MLVDQPPPDPAGLAPTDAVVEIESACVSYIDLLMLTGQYHGNPPANYQQSKVETSKPHPSTLQ